MSKIKPCMRWKRKVRVFFILPEFRAGVVLGEGDAGLAPSDGRGRFLHPGRLAQQFHPAAHLAVTIPHGVAVLVQDVQLRGWKGRFIHKIQSCKSRHPIKHTPPTKYHYFTQEENYTRPPKINNLFVDFQWLLFIILIVMYTFTACNVVQCAVCVCAAARWNERHRGNEHAYIFLPMRV